jgi:plastin-3
LYRREQFSKNYAKAKVQVLENCNYAVELGKKMSFILVGIDGNDLQTGNKTLTLGLVWQLMRKYTLSLLSKLSPDGTPIVETEILTWANQRLSDAGKNIKVKHFQVIGT